MTTNDKQKLELISLILGCDDSSVLDRVKDFLKAEEAQTMEKRANLAASDNQFIEPEEASPEIQEAIKKVLAGRTNQSGRN